MSVVEKFTFKLIIKISKLIRIYNTYFIEWRETKKEAGVKYILQDENPSYI